MSKSTYTPILPFIQSFYQSRKKKSIAILDYGCGDGTVMEFLSSIEFHTYDGIEVNKGSVEYGNKKYEDDSRIHFYHITTTSFPKTVLKKKYDLIIFLGVTPYMSNEEISEFFEMAHSVLNPKGIIVGYSRTDHLLYSLTDLYQIFLPHTSISTKKLLQIAAEHKFRTVFKKEMGLILAPLFNNTFVLGFDALDKILLRTKGTLGFFGKTSRSLMAPLIDLEQSLDFDYGYKLYFVFQKKG